jgi:AraC family transcriptional regulator
MTPVAKAVWFIETHVADELSLADVATAAGVSRFHMARVFGTATGQSVMRYVRSRRLTEAAKTLANGAPDILSVALEAGYGSHEAFTRAFRDRFGVTPDRARTAASVATLSLTEAFSMDDIAKTTLTPPRMTDGGPLLIAGLKEHFRFEDLAGLPSLWHRFRPFLGSVPGQIGQTAYGVCYNTDDAEGFDYIAGVEVADAAAVPKDFESVRLTPQLYAVFTHARHISAVRGTFTAIFNDWLPRSGLQSADAAVFERYDERFDGRTGLGGFEIWVPVKR